MLISTLSSIKNKSLTFLEGQLGTVAWEHLLVIAGVSVAIIFAVGVAAPSLTSEMLNGTCKSMKTVFEPARHPEKGVHNHGFKLSCPKIPK